MDYRSWLNQTPRGDRAVGAVAGGEEGGRRQQAAAAPQGGLLDPDDRGRAGEAKGLSDSPVVGTYALLGRIRTRQGDADRARVAHEHALAVQRYPVERFHALVELLPVRHADDDHEGVEELLAEAVRLEPGAPTSACSRAG